MKHSARNAWLIAWTILIEAVRRKEIYIVVVVAAGLLGGFRYLSFFDLHGLGKFYREISLKTMNVATSLTAILLAARQLPREIRDRTLYPLLAKPVSRLEFILGKYAGVLLAGAFCYSLFMVIFLAGALTLASKMVYPLFFQGIYLQLWSLSVLITMTFTLSLLFNADAALTIATTLYFFSQILMTLMSALYDLVGPVRQMGLLALHFVIPQLTLFDVSAKIVHGVWPPIPLWAMAELTAYGAAYTALFLALSAAIFRRKAL